MPLYICVLIVWGTEQVFSKGSDSLERVCRWLNSGARAGGATCRTRAETNLRRAEESSDCYKALKDHNRCRGSVRLTSPAWFEYISLSSQVCWILTRRPGLIFNQLNKLWRSTCLAEKRLNLTAAIVIFLEGTISPESCSAVGHTTTKTPLYLQPFLFGTHERRGYDPSFILTYC